MGKHNYMIVAVEGQDSSGKASVTVGVAPPEVPVVPTVLPTVLPTSVVTEVPTVVPTTVATILPTLRVGERS